MLAGHYSGLYFCNLNYKTMKSYIFFGSILLLSACSDTEGPQLDMQAPKIEIIAPYADQVLTAGQTINIDLRITENQELHHYSIVLRNADRSVAETLASGHLHDVIFEYENALTLPALTAQEYILTVKASDHNDNQATQQISWWVE